MSTVGYAGLTGYEGCTGYTVGSMTGFATFSGTEDSLLNASTIFSTVGFSAAFSSGVFSGVSPQISAFLCLIF